MKGDIVVSYRYRDFKNQKSSTGASYNIVAPLRSENLIFLMKCNIVVEVKLGPYTKTELLKGATVGIFVTFGKMKLLFLYDIFLKII